MTSMWKRGSRRLSHNTAIIVVCPSVDRREPVPFGHETMPSCADSPSMT